jgi:peptide methionine sulfoxide reductase MsrB
VNRHSTKDGRPPEITCANCGGHLGLFCRINGYSLYLTVHLYVGHIFDGKRYKHHDGRPIEERHCVNSVSLKFKRKE